MSPFLCGATLCSAIETPDIDYTSFIKHTLNKTPYSETALSEKIDQKLRDETVSQEWVTDQYLLATYLGYINICDTLVTLPNEVHQPLLAVREIVAQPKKDKEFINKTLRGTPYALDAMTTALNDKILKGTLTQEWVTDKYVASIYLGYTTVSAAFEQLQYKEHTLYPAVQRIVSIKQQEEHLYALFKESYASLNELALYVMNLKA